MPEETFSLMEREPSCARCGSREDLTFLLEDDFCRDCFPEELISITEAVREEDLRYWSPG